TGDKPTGPLGVDLSRPLAEQTADQVVGTLSTGVPRPSAGASPGKAPQRLGLALALGQMPRPQSVEVKRFLENRKPPRKGSLQVILVLRGKPRREPLLPRRAGLRGPPQPGAPARVLWKLPPIP